MVDLWVDLRTGTSSNPTSSPDISPDTFADTPEEFVLTERIHWQSLWTAFKLDITATAPVETLLRVKRQKNDACLITGSIQGIVCLPCARCTEQASVVLNQSLELFEQADQPEEQAPHTPHKQAQNPDPGPALLRRQRNTLQLNAGQILWEYFLLALPDKALCNPQCKGLCPVCGINRNTQACTCEKQTLDPRLAVLRKLKISG